MRCAILSTTVALLLATAFVADASSHQGARPAARRAQQGAVSPRADHAAIKHEKRQSGGGRATFYDPSVGPGACGRTMQKSDPIVAVNSAQFKQSDCFKWITVTANGKSVSAQITDACPGCPYGALDFSPAVFNQFASPSEGIFQMTWSLGGGGGDDDKKQSTTTTQRSTRSPSPRPTSTRTPTPSSTWTPPPSTTSSSSSRSSSSSSRSSSTTSSSSSTTSSSSTAAPSSTSSASSASATATSRVASPSAASGNNLAGLVKAVNGFYAMAGSMDGKDDEMDA